MFEASIAYKQHTLDIISNCIVNIRKYFHSTNEITKKKLHIKIM